MRARALGRARVLGQARDRICLERRARVPHQLVFGMRLRWRGPLCEERLEEGHATTALVDHRVRPARLKLLAFRAACRIARHAEDVALAAELAEAARSGRAAQLRHLIVHDDQVKRLSLLEHDANRFLAVLRMHVVDAEALESAERDCPVDEHVILHVQHTEPVGKAKLARRGRGRRSRASRRRVRRLARRAKGPIAIGRAGLHGALSGHLRGHPWGGRAHAQRVGRALVAPS
mmetsp:Transcript_8093/g.20813  ORF Transcript_8093/g.20813 Transcript_8093/m.20813 type:complete len:233 (-) Transcript_8093:226-924(-)